MDGRVVRPSGASTVGVAQEWVVLHRVGTDQAGPVDSMRTRGDGGYRFRYRFRDTGDTAAVYFVSTSRGGVAYFTPPLREPALRGGPADILVYDTTSAPIPIKVLGRHLIVTAADTSKERAGKRTIVEVYEIGNDSTVTRVAGRGPTFDAPLPSAVESVTAGDGDISSDAIAIIDGRLHLTAPLSPGIKQFSFFYEVPRSMDLITYRVEGAIPVLEVLIEDPRGSATGAGLIEATPVQVDGRPFKRYLAQDVADSATFVVNAPGRDLNSLRLMLIVTAVGAALLLGLGMAFMQKGPGAFGRRRDESPESLAHAIAALDAQYERIASPTREQKNEHYLARAQLKGRLSAVLAKQDGLR